MANRLSCVLVRQEPRPQHTANLSLDQLMHGRREGQARYAPDQGGILDDQESHGNGPPGV